MINFTCLLAQVDLTANPVPRPPLMVPVQRGEPRSLAEVYGSYSSGDIVLTIDGGSLAQPLDLDFESVDEGILQEALNSLTKNPGDQPVRRLGILYSNKLREVPSAFGFMFDTAFSGDDTSIGHRPREGCSVFVDAIAALRSGDDYFKQLGFTTAHELGHVFNLHHVDTDLCYLNTSKQDNAPSNGACRFLSNQAELLASCSHNPSVEPGMTEFDGSLTSDGLDKPRRAPATPWTLDVALSQEEFFPYEPVDLMLSLSLDIKASRPRPAAGVLNPSYRQLTVWIEEPSGEVRRYRPTLHLCGTPELPKVAPGKSIHEALRIFGQAGGYTFRRFGRHRLWATLDTGSKRQLVSSKISFDVKSFLVKTRAAREEIGAQRKILRRTARTLFYQSAKLRMAELEMLDYLAAKHPKQRLAAWAHHAIGCSFAAHDYSCRAAVPAFRARALKHLHYSADHAASHHFRRAEAQRRLTNLSKAPGEWLLA